jgi:heme-degrading monooxygenase HmoA
MLCALTVRRLKPGAFEDFRRAWEMDSDEFPPGWTRAYTVRNVEDENEVISFGFFEGSLEDLRRSQEEFDYASQRAAVDEHVESAGTDGIFEVVIEEGA